jgi:hypothetical protein
VTATTLDPTTKFDSDDVGSVTDYFLLRLGELVAPDALIRVSSNQLGYVDLDSASVYLITIQHAEFTVNE